MARDFSAPLSDAERTFAADNCYLIEKYLKKRNLPVNEWYDVVVFRYLRSVKRWFALPELHKHGFEVIAFFAMRSAVGHEMERQRRQIKAYSLDDVIPGTDGMTYADVVTRHNLDYIQYGGEEPVKVDYNVALPPRRVFRGKIKSEEVIAIETFLGSARYNMRFEYDSPEEAKRRLNSVLSYRRKQSLQARFDAYRDGKCVYVFRPGTKEGEAQE